MASPSVTKRFSDLVAPDLLALGFTPNGNKQYRRVAGDIFQGFFLHVETRSLREFMIEYCAFLVCVPQRHHNLEHGGRFPVGSRGAWYRADSAQRLQQSMIKVRSDLPALLGWYRECESLDGFLRTFELRCAARPLPPVGSGHTSMTLACGYARAGEFRSAKTHAEQALSYFQTTLDLFRVEFPNYDHWAPEYIDYAKALLAAIDGAGTDALLTKWRGVTVDALRLREI